MRRKGVTVGILSLSISLSPQLSNNSPISQRVPEPNPDEPMRLDTVSDFHLGDLVNVFVPGSLSMPGKDVSQLQSTMVNLPILLFVEDRVLKFSLC